MNEDQKNGCVLISVPGAGRGTGAAPVHINAGFAGQTSDHDPLLADFTFRP